MRSKGGLESRAMNEERVASGNEFVSSVGICDSRREEFGECRSMCRV